MEIPQNVASRQFYVGETMPCLPPMTGNGLCIPPIYKNGDFSGGWFIYGIVLPTLMNRPQVITIKHGMTFLLSAPHDAQGTMIERGGAGETLLECGNDG